nr:hypothetical protein [Pantoea cypripedii]
MPNEITRYSSSSYYPEPLPQSQNALRENSNTHSNNDAVESYNHPTYHQQNYDDSGYNSAPSTSTDFSQPYDSSNQYPSASTGNSVPSVPQYPEFNESSSISHELISKGVDSQLTQVKAALENGKWGVLTDEFRQLEQEMNSTVKENVNHEIQSILRQADVFLSKDTGSDEQKTVLMRDIRNTGCVNAFIRHSSNPAMRKNIDDLIMKAGGDTSRVSQLVDHYRDVQAMQTLRRLDSLKSYFTNVDKQLEWCRNTGELTTGRMKENIRQLQVKIDSGLGGVNSAEDLIKSRLLIQKNKTASSNQPFSALSKKDGNLTTRFERAMEACQGDDSESQLNGLRTSLQQSGFYESIFQANKLIPDGPATAAIQDRVGDLNEDLKVQSNKLKAMKHASALADANRWHMASMAEQKKFRDEAITFDKGAETSTYHNTMDLRRRMNLVDTQNNNQNAARQADKIPITVKIHSTEYRSIEGKGGSKTALTGTPTSTIQMNVPRDEYEKYRAAQQKGDHKKAEGMIQQWAKKNGSTIPSFSARANHVEGKTGDLFTVSVDRTVDAITASSSGDKTYKNQYDVHDALSDTKEALKVGEAISFGRGRRAIAETAASHTTPSSSTGKNTQLSSSYRTQTQPSLAVGSSTPVAGPSSANGISSVVLRETQHSQQSDEPINSSRFMRGMNIVHMDKKGRGVKHRSSLEVPDNININSLLTKSDSAKMVKVDGVPGLYKDIEKNSVKDESSHYKLKWDENNWISMESTSKDGVYRSLPTQDVEGNEQANLLLSYDSDNHSFNSHWLNSDAFINVDPKKFKVISPSLQDNRAVKIGTETMQGVYTGVMGRNDVVWAEVGVRNGEKIYISLKQDESESNVFWLNEGNGNQQYRYNYGLKRLERGDENAIPGARGFPAQLGFHGNGQATVHLKDGTSVKVDINASDTLTGNLLSKRFQAIDDGINGIMNKDVREDALNIFDVNKIEIDQGGVSRSVYFPDEKFGKFNYSDMLFDNTKISFDSRSKVLMTPDDYDGVGRYDNLHIIKQGTMDSCGPSSATMLLMDLKDSKKISDDEIDWFVGQSKNRQSVMSFDALSSDLNDAGLSNKCHLSENPHEYLSEKLQSPSWNGILNVDGHFVVATGAGNGEFYLRDPYQGVLSLERIEKINELLLGKDIIEIT